MTKEKQGIGVGVHHVDVKKLIIYMVGWKFVAHV